MKTVLIAILFCFTAAQAQGPTIWMLCDICEKKIHTNEQKLSKGDHYEDRIEVENAIGVASTPTSSEASNASADGLLSLVPTEDISAVIAGHGNKTKHICKQCYDAYAWTIFRQVDSLWESYWVGVKARAVKVTASQTDTTHPRIKSWAKEKR